jgi:hypothetical protein
LPYPNFAPAARANGEGLACGLFTPNPENGIQKLPFLLVSTEIQWLVYAGFPAAPLVAGSSQKETPVDR